MYAVVLADESDVIDRQHQDDDKRPYDRNKEYQQRFHQSNRSWILEKKKVINAQPHIKQRNAQYHKIWYQNSKMLL
jgi:hypothetical protein